MLSIGIVQWDPFDGLADAFEYEFTKMGHQPVKFLHTDAIPPRLDIVLSFAPYQRFFPLAQRIGRIPKSSRPVFIHWASENVPDARLPKPITLMLSRLRVTIDRMQDSASPAIQRLAKGFPLKRVNQGFHRFRHIADYRDAYRKGWLNILADISIIYTGYFNQFGIPAIHVPWGASTLWYEDLGLERDIGVMWMGKRRTRHRSNLIDQVEKEMNCRGIEMFIADGIKHPFIFNENRIEILNRTSITLNLQYIPYIHTLPLRFGFTAGNKSLVLAEESPNHSPEIIPGVHYASTPANQLVEKILFYLEHNGERERITRNAFNLVTTQLTLQNSLQKLISAAETLN